MKKAFVLFITAIMLMTVLGCGKQHEHTWADWEVTKAATVEEEGEKQRICSKCGATETESIPKLKIMEVELTKDNFSEYFEFSTGGRLYVDAFGAATGYEAFAEYALKDEYANRVPEMMAYSNNQSCAIKYTITGRSVYLILLDSNNTNARLEAINSYDIDPVQESTNIIGTMGEDGKVALTFVVGFFPSTRVDLLPELPSENQISIEDVTGTLYLTQE